MGNCYCKYNPITAVITDVAVPGIDDDNSDQHFHIADANRIYFQKKPGVTTSRMKTFLKLKSQKELAKIGERSTEQFLIRNNTMQAHMVREADEFRFSYVTKTTSTKIEKSTFLQSTLKEGDKFNTREDETQFFNLLRQHFLFRNFDDLMLKQIFDQVMGFQIEEGSIIFEEEEEGSCLFLIKTGQVEITRAQATKKILGPGECFGELALIHENTKRNSTAKAITLLDFYALEGSAYRRICKEFGRDISVYLSYIDSISWFHQLEQIEKVFLAMLGTTQVFERGEKIIVTNKKAKDKSDKIYIVMKGSLCYLSKNGESDTYTEGMSYGEKSVILDIKDKCDHEVLSTAKSECYVISQANLEEALGLNFRDAILQSIYRYSVMKNKYLTNLLMEFCLERLYKSMTLNVYTNGQVVVEPQARKNKKEKMVLVLEGTLVNVK